MTPTLASLLHRLRRLAALAADSDAALLERFTRHRDEGAFAALVGRHGPMVLNLCRRLLGDAHAAEDCFQATFLVLARKARSVARPAALAGWLYGVARRVALKARSSRRPCAELTDDRACPDPRRDPLAELTARDMLRVLEEEVGRLPEAHRLPVVLCCLEGLSLEEAARRLGATPGSVRARLARGRRRLRLRLARRGLTLPAALAPVVVSRASFAAVSVALRDRTVAMATVSARGGGEVASPLICSLAEGVCRAMAIKQAKLVFVVLLLGLLGTGAFLYRLHAEGTDPAQGKAGEPPGRAARPAAQAKTPGPDKTAAEKQAKLQLRNARDALLAAQHEYEQLEEDYKLKLITARVAVAEQEEYFRALERRQAAERAREERALRAAENELRKQKHLRGEDLARKELQELEERARQEDAQRLTSLLRRRELLARGQEQLRQLEREQESKSSIAEAKVRDAARWVRRAEQRLHGATEAPGGFEDLEQEVRALRRELAELRRALERQGQKDRPPQP
jgi:RNA polymerase sigma factor (sigma-70 family)